MTTLNIILGQTKIGYDDYKLAFSELESFFDEDDKEQPRVLLLPEMWPCGFNRDKIFKLIQHEKSFIRHLKTFAEKYNIYLAVPIPMKISVSTDKLHNTFICISPEGKILSEYKKMHLFPLTGEAEVFQAGQQPVLIDIEGFTIGFATCYDLRFPELFREYAHKGADVVFTSACFPIPRQSDWLTLLRARAIENQYYVVGVNSSACEDVMGNELTYFGHSVAVAPTGMEIVSMQQNPVLEQVNLERNQIKKAREKIHFLKDLSYAFKR